MLCSRCQQWLVDVLQQMSERTDGLGDLPSEPIDVQARYDIDRLGLGRPLCWLCTQIRSNKSRRKSVEAFRNDPLYTGAKILPGEVDFRTPPFPRLDQCLQLRYLGAGSSPTNATVTLSDHWPVAWLDFIRPNSNGYTLPTSSKGFYRFEGNSSAGVEPHLTGVGNLEHIGTSESGWSDAPEKPPFKVLTQERIDSIKRWLHECDSEHPCKAITNSLDDGERYLPKRLLHFTKSSDMVRLVYPESMSDLKELTYATLSHCWGRDDFLKLNRSNHDQMAQGIPLSDLGRTFVETVKLCQSLDIQYLWLDSFCIIQGDGDDWLQEAPKMQQVYGGSYLNLAATSSRSCNEGLVRPLAPELAYLSVELSASLHLVGRPHLMTHSSYKVHMLVTPLFQRGWVLQELFLSARNLHMTRSGMQWQCKWMKKREPVAAGRESALLSAVEGWTDLTASYVGFAESPDALDRMWAAVIHAFSRTVTTFPADRYWALSGLAALFRQRYAELGVRPEYVAGHWRHDLVRSLIWEPAPEGQVVGKIPTNDSGDGNDNDKDNDKPCIPSWSRLVGFSVSGVLDSPYTENVTVLAEVLRVQQAFAPQTASEFGPPLSIDVALRAAFFTVTLAIERTEEDGRGPADVSQPLRARDRRGAEMLVAADVYDFTFSWDDGRDDEEHVGPVEDCVFMCGQSTGHWFGFWALMLEEAGRADDGLMRYRRCGQLVVERDTYGDEFLRYLQSVERPKEDFYLI